MEKQVVQKRWKLIFWGLTAAAVALLAPGLVLTGAVFSALLADHVWKRRKAL